ncbi:DNA polymerase ligase N-terminal domain-containing protein [Wolbachia endosymbiont of Anurida maritima]|uniref:DNA polymerase ligase N-terminal domain-containing protein n=1 Tax=Wolbachia endosymbiont of Anurida maritima TaxID=2850562 RepID=UPI0035D0F919
MSLQQKQDFTKTKEPKGDNQALTKPIFVVQTHSASHLHYDFRLEINGVLKSWVIPKGPSSDTHDKRLAIETEDHPLEYANFEGVIPKGEYGAGTVEIWDKGTFDNITKKNGEIVPVDQALKDGHIDIWLDGHKLKGGFTLIFFKKEKNSKQWLLIKKYQ